MNRQAAFELARLYSQLGIPAFPITQTKMPATANGFKDATTDNDKLLRLFQDVQGDIGVGLWPGPAGYIGVDIDNKGTHKGSAEWEAWQEK